MMVLYKNDFGQCRLSENNDLVSHLPQAQTKGTLGVKSSRTLAPSWCSTHGVRSLTMFLSRVDPSSALDFLWACSHIPRIWQGRDQKTPQVRHWDTL